MTQEQTIKIALQGHNIFLTGRAGTGKTYTLNLIMDELKAKGKVIARTASTGIAATHINGTTIHSFSGIGIKEKFVGEDLYKICNNRFTKKRIEPINVLVIDEISMLHGYYLDIVDEVFRFVKKSPKPFGGVQVILCGDMHQLPPVSKENKKATYAFYAMSWISGDFKTCYLDKIYRQNEPEFIDLLNNIRVNEVTDKQKLLLNSLKDNIDNKDKAINLYFKNVSVDTENKRQLDMLDTREKKWSMQTDGLPFAVQKILDNWLGNDVLSLKLGSKVMFIKNDFQRGFVNGSMGTVVGFSSDANSKIDPLSSYPVVELFESGKSIIASPAEWKTEEENEFGQVNKVASVIQVPLRLAYAITIHKSQGCTFDYVNLDLRDVRDFNMGYVALSRVRSLSGLHLIGYNFMSLRTDPSIHKHDAVFKQESEVNENGF